MKKRVYLIIAMICLLGLVLGLYDVSMPKSPEALRVKQTDNAMKINWRLSSTPSGKYQLVVVEGEDSRLRVEGVNLETIKREELFSEEAVNDYHNLYLFAFEKSPFYKPEAGYTYYIIPSDYEGLLTADNKMYYLYLYKEAMGPTRPYWIKELVENGSSYRLVK